MKMFRYLQPTLFSGLLDDPVLIVQVRPTGRSIMLDCGQIHHLAKRVLRSVDAIFISHAHMDHFMGVDHLIRNVHVAPRTIRLYGPPGIAERFRHKVSAYDWNLAETHWCDFEVYEVHRTHLEQFLFCGSQGFTARPPTTLLRQKSVIYRTPHLKVEAELCDHKIPALIFRVTEQPSFKLEPARLLAAGLLPGPWLGELKRRFHSGNWQQGPLELLRSDPPRLETIDSSAVAALYRDICRDAPPAGIGYISDLGYTDDNRARILRLLGGVSLLVSECTFLAAEQDKARSSHHLCTSDLNELAGLLRPTALLPMHLSKAYSRRSQEIYAELEPPPGTRLLRLPAYRTPRPLLPCELPSLDPPSGHGS